MTEDEARMLGKAIRESAEMVSIPIKDPIERRAICVKLAMETKGVAFSLKNDGTLPEAAQQVLEAAQLYYAFVTGEAP